MFTGAALTLASTAMIIGSVWSFTQRPSPDADLDLSEQSLQLVEARRDLERASLDIVSARMMDAIGLEGDRRGRLAAAAEEVETTVAEIEALADLDTDVGAEARAMLDDLWEAPLSDPLTADLTELFDNGEYGARYAGGSDTVTDRTGALHQFTFVGSLPEHIMIEGIVLDNQITDRPIDPSAARFFEYIAVITSEGGGWLGPMLEQPFVDSPWIDLDAALDEFPDEVERASDTIASSPLPEYDAWMRLTVDSDGPPPLTLAALDDVTNGVERDLDVIVDDVLSGDSQAVVEARAAAERDALSRAALALAGLLVGLVGLSFGARSLARQIGAARAVAAMASVDPLTGVGNRHELDDRVQPALFDRRLRHHVLTMIDLDRFKMVNDTYGHAAGDAVLVDVAEGLVTIGQALTDGVARASSYVVRLGGDEFLLSVHSPDPIDGDELTGRLDRLRTASIEVDGETFVPGFSVGSVEVEGIARLDDVLRSADLAVYEDKAARRAIVPTGRHEFVD